MNESDFWRTPGERYLPECIVVTVKFGGGGMICSCFLGVEFGSLVPLKETLNASA